MFNLSSVSSPQYIPSHLSQSHSRNTQQPRASPPHLKRSSTSKFGGSSFGTPRPSRTTRSQDSSLEDAPPTESIYDHEGGSQFTINSSDTTPQFHLSVNESASSGHSTLASVPTAVIIFGFPSHMTSQVMTYFSKFGTIQEHATSDAQNLSMGHNWMKITYKDTAAAKQAVNSNGASVGGSYMVGCVYAPDEPLANSDNHSGDAMEIDPMTPPRFKPAASQYYPAAQNTPLRTPVRMSATGGKPTSTPGGRKIEILSSDAIYKSDSPITQRAASWIPQWLTGTADDDNNAKSTSATATSSDAHANSSTTNNPGWASRTLQGLVDIVFGF